MRDWWRSRGSVTLVCRPRRFGKTLNLDTVRCFLSREFAGRGEELFGGLEVWGEAGMRELQGTVPVVAMSFANVKGATLDVTLAGTRRVMREAVEAHDYLRDSDALTDGDRAFLDRVSDDMLAEVAVDAVNQLCSMLCRHWGVAPVVLLDEYDAPMEAAWVGGYWDEASSFMRQLMNATFKTNPAMGRGLITGVTRVSRESIFSDLNNLNVVTASTSLYKTRFGFTQAEVDAALEDLVHAKRRLRLTNLEVEATFDRIVEGWFGEADADYGELADALLAGDAEAMGDYLSDVVLACASSFDSAT